MAVLTKASTGKAKSELPVDLQQAIKAETRFINCVLKMAEEEGSEHLQHLLNIAREHIRQKLEFIDARLAELGSKKERLGSGRLRGFHKLFSIPVIEKRERALADDRKKTEELLKQVNEKIASAQKAEASKTDVYRRAKTG